MSTRRLFVIMFALILVPLSVFIGVYQHYAVTRMRRTVTEHVNVIAESFWNYDLANTAYLSLAAQANHYETIVLEDTFGLVHQRITGPPPTPLERWLIAVKLMPLYTFQQVILYNTETIGMLTVVWRCQTIYPISYVALCLVFIASGTGLSLRLLVTKRQIVTQNAALQQEIAERKHAERALLEAKERAETANRAKSQFLANMSHELRTPLNAILGFAQLMQRDAALTTNQREPLNTILRSGEHLLKLINDVLEMSKIEAGYATAHLDTCDLWHVLLSLEEMIQVRAQHKGLQFVVMRAPDVPRYIRTDESKLRQILINLLGNAVKFTEQGEVELRVETRCIASEEETHSSASLRFEISDTGIGIAVDEVEAVFETFWRSQRSQQAIEGTGLGLAISQQFARLLEGEITVQSELGKGSVFRLTLPVEVVDTPPSGATHDRRRVLTLAPGQAPPRILIVEDTEASRAFIAQLLQAVGFLVVEARNGQEAIAQWQQQRPDLIFMDMRMPVMDGYEATRKIRTAEAAATSEAQQSKSQIPNPKSQIPIIALTASAFEEEHAQILAAGCQTVLNKPIQEETIFDTLRTFLGVEYVYADEENPETTDAERGTGDDSLRLTPEMLASLPPEILQLLEQAAAQVNVKRVNEAIVSVRHHNASVADALASLAQDFKYQDIWNMLQQVKHG